MPVRLWPSVYEKATPYGDPPSYELMYHADGSEDLADIKAAAAAGLPATYQTDFFLQEYSTEHVGGGVWDLHVKYGMEDQYTKFTSDSTGGTIHRDYALETVGGFDETGTFDQVIADAVFGGLIGVNNNEVTGVDVPEPKQSITITKRFLASSLDPGFSDVVRSMSGSVNDDQVVFIWRGQIKTYQGGELRFLGASENDGGTDKNGGLMIEFGFKFEWSRNVEDLTIGAITDIDKKGWHYLWVFQERRPQNASGVVALVRRPKFVIVNRVSPETDFSALNIFE